MIAALAPGVAVASAILQGASLAEEAPPAPPVFAIENARLVPVSAPVLERGTLVVRDGLIEALGAGVEAPPGAWVIDGEGLTVYPGLIDALSRVGLGADDPEAAQPAAYSQGPEDRPATTPWVKAADLLRPSDEAITKWREAGFAASVVAPADGLVPGQASLINLAGLRPGEMVVEESVALRLALAPHDSSRGFPSALMGVHAYLRQLFLDAAHFAEARRQYQAEPRGRRRPDYDNTLVPIADMIDSATPLLLPARTAPELRRARAMAASIGMRPLLYGGHGAYAATRDLAGTGAAVLVSLAWPLPDKDADPEQPPSLRELRLWDLAPSTPFVLEQAGVPFAFTTEGMEAPDKALEKVGEAVAAGLPPEAALRALTLSAAEIFGVSDRLGSLEEGKIANLLITEGELWRPGVKPRMVVVDGRVFDLEDEEPSSSAEKAVSAPPPVEGEAVASAAESDREDPVSITLIHNVTVLPVSTEALEGGEVLVRNGKIEAVGRDLSVPTGARIINGEGGYLTPGIIDCHSHLATSGGTNESTVAVSSMARIQDVVDPEDIGLYRALAGGVTAINILHGSANPIGGLNAVIKLRWGQTAAGLLFEGAPPGIKFALGENPKRSNSAPSATRPQRYPATRMGVIDVVRQSFLEAKDYRDAWQEFAAKVESGQGAEALPPRRDLELEPLAEVLSGTRLVHAHSYRSDEIVQLLRLAEELGFRIATLQHVLEGYRVADEIAAHGAGASTFSDHWAYKVEAYEAIPHNAALMAERGVVVSINSDSAEEIRHLNQEAAKAMKWGGLSEVEALKLVTLNPAKQLGIADRVGSIEVGKDADLVIWDRHPLSVYAVAQKTLIDGQIYFDRVKDLAERESKAREREALEGRLARRAPVEGKSSPELEDGSR